VGDRVTVYVDGFNLYFGMKSKGWRRHYWLNIVQLANRLLKPGQQLVEVKYFTARIGANAPKAARQNAYLEALGTLPGLSIHYGHYLSGNRTCPKCGFQIKVPSEKMTDVNIATEMLTDAFSGACDTALLLSADSDLTRPVQVIRSRFGRRVIVVFPPDRHSATLAGAATAAFTLGVARIRQSQFPPQVAKPDGTILQRPAAWR
jgi:uncharacterized LabA/DUF88 family protein